MIALLTWTNTRGLEYGKIIQNVFTTAKTGALVGLILVGLLLGWNQTAVADNFGNLWTPRGTVEIVPGLSAITAFGLFVAICVSQTGSLFSADAWNNITFTAGEVKDPRRNIPLSLALGTFIVIGLYLLANVAYLVTLPFDQIQHAPGDRVATATLNAIFPGLGVTIMAIGIMISTFGCTNGLILAGARAYYAMARDGLFFRAVWTAEPGEGAGLGAGAAGALGDVSRAAADLRSGHARVRQSVQQPARLHHLRGADLLHPDDRRHLPAAPDAAGRRSAVSRRRLSRRSRRCTSSARRSSCWCSSSTGRRRPGRASIIVLLGVPVYFAWKPKARGFGD